MKNENINKTERPSDNTQKHTDKDKARKEQMYS